MPHHKIKSKQEIQIVRKREAEDAAYIFSSNARAREIKKDAESLTGEPNIGRSGLMKRK